MKKKTLLFIAAFVFFPVLLSQHPFAAEQSETLHQEITWEQLLPESAHDENFSTDRHISDTEVEAYIKRRMNASSNPSLQGRNIKIYGFVVPLERNEASSLTEFLLVPYFGACIHAPPPPQSQIIHVSLGMPVEGIQAMDTVFVYGKMSVEKAHSAVGEAAYRIQAAGIEKKISPSIARVVLAVSLTMACGLSICLGWFGPMAAIRRNRRMLGPGVAFAAGLMTCLGFSTVVAGISVEAVCMFLGSVAVMAIVEFLPYAKKRQPAAEQGKKHIHVRSMSAIAFHNFPECFIVFSSAMTDAGLGLILGGAMAAHNIPLGISIALASSKESPHRAQLYSVLTGCLPPLAAMAAYFFLRPLFLPDTVRMLFACAGGILVFIALAELVPLARRLGGFHTTLGAFSVGALLLFFTLIFFYRG